MQLPDVLKEYQPEAESDLKQGRVGHVEFSGETYQVHVQDPSEEEGVWAFLQLDARGRLRDCFCSCEKSDDSPACRHVAAAYLKIYNNHPAPLHIRFEKSFWNHLCLLGFDHYGKDPEDFDCLKKSFRLLSQEGEEVFQIGGENKEIFQIFLERKKETEETSLKFSNLTQDEILLWRSGRPNEKLRYELSVWSDAAKLLMIQQEDGKPYSIGFSFGEKGLPNSVKIRFPDLYVIFFFKEEWLPDLIPSLATVKSELAVHYSSHEISAKIFYDKKERCLRLDSKGRQVAKAVPADRGIAVGDWIFVPDSGFYSREKHDLLEKKVVKEPEIPAVLDRYYQTIKELLHEVHLYEDPIGVSYAAAFDRKWNLHISAFLFVPGDLGLRGSWLRENWAYLEDDGFYRVTGRAFENVETIVPANEMTEFIRQNRIWLNQQEGFHIHLASIESHLTYMLSDENRLTFLGTIAISEEEYLSKDFGPWVYIAGQGFYTKTGAHAYKIKPDMEVTEDHIPLFIKANAEELQLIQGFFSGQCPVKGARIDVELRPGGTIHLLPVYEYFPDYDGREVRHFDEYVFVPGEGFHELPGACRLPEKFRHPMFIDPPDQEDFILKDLPSLRPCIKKLDPSLQKPDYLNLEVKALKGMEKGYEAIFQYQSPQGDVWVTDLYDALTKKQRFVLSRAGLLDLDSKRFHWLRKLQKANVNLDSKKILLSTQDLLKFNAFENFRMSRDAPGWKLFSEVIEFKSPEKPQFTKLKSTLRPYQILGVEWLWFLYKHRLSGLLCDDMGLGKTHQAMALMAAIMQEGEKKTGAKPVQFLIACPTSVLYHWQEKLEAFLPEARVCLFYGSERRLGDFEKENNILLTSYGVLRVESSRISRIPFTVAIFDEVQVAKNYASRVHASLLAVDSKMRLGLTGTPIENRLRELKSLFDIVLPGFMPPETEYREAFIKPIEKGNERQRKSLLRRLINPFVLRRKKGDVLLDLPEKIEEVAHCDLFPKQKELYKKTLQKRGRALIQELRDQSAPVPYMHVFSILTLLKQICDHPAVFLKCPEDYEEYQSGKWNLFLELLYEARESQQKVVVFSQYLAMLDIIEDYLTANGIGFATIRGATTNRGEQLERFNQDPECEVFIGSLGAAGLGIDLTAASVVIHYDRWWNAARENQATDRVHRIGQTRGVQVFKLVTKGTLEEGIDNMIARKGILMEEVIGVDDHDIIKRLNREEIIQILQQVV